MRVAFIGKIGNDILGSLCKEELERKKVDTSMIISSTELKTGATVILNFGEDRAMITYQGAMKHLGITDITKEMLSMSKHLHFSSYFLQPGFKNSLAGLLKWQKKPD